MSLNIPFSPDPFPLGLLRPASRLLDRACTQAGPTSSLTRRVAQHTFTHASAVTHERGHVSPQIVNRVNNVCVCVCVYVCKKSVSNIYCYYHYYHANSASRMRNSVCRQLDINRLSSLLKPGPSNRPSLAAIITWQSTTIYLSKIFFSHIGKYYFLFSWKLLLRDKVNWSLEYST